MTDGKSTKIQSSHIRFGRRTYFFDVKQGANDKKFLKITESKFMGEDKDRLYNSFLLFPEDVEDFQRELTEVAGALA